MRIVGHLIRKHTANASFSKDKIKSSCVGRGEKFQNMKWHWLDFALGKDRRFIEMFHPPIWEKSNAVIAWLRLVRKHTANANRGSFIRKHTADASFSYDKIKSPCVGRGEKFQNMKWPWLDFALGKDRCFIEMFHPSIWEKSSAVVPCWG